MRFPYQLCGIVAAAVLLLGAIVALADTINFLPAAQYNVDASMGFCGGFNCSISYDLQHDPAGTALPDLTVGCAACRHLPTTEKNVMRKSLFLVLAAALASTCAFAVDGVVLINQSTVTAAGGFPYTITQPGSYKLSGNLTPPLNVTAIQISTGNVSLDLNGFTISCSMPHPSPYLRRGRQPLFHGSIPKDRNPEWSYRCIPSRRTDTN